MVLVKYSASEPFAPVGTSIRSWPADMPPLASQQDPPQKYVSPFAPRPASTSTAESGSSRASSGFSSSSQGATSITSQGFYGSSYHVSHSHPDPPRQTTLPFGRGGRGSAASGLSYRPTSSTSQNQNAHSRSSHGSRGPTLLSTQNHAGGSSHGFGQTQRPSPQSQSQNGNSISRSEYKASGSTSQSQVGNSWNHRGHHQRPVSSSSKTQSSLSSSGYRSTANPSHPSHYKPSLLQYSSTPDPTTPKSKFQVVLNSSPSKPFDVSSYSMQESRPHLSDAATHSARRGRPPKNSLLRAEAPSSLPPKKRGRPFKDYSEVPELTPKKRGRPFKTLEGELRAAARANSSADPKKRGRPFKIRHQVEIAPPEAVFNPFICEWRGCPAELQNMETLRLHVYNVHRKRVDGKVLCLWGKCGKEPPSTMQVVITAKPTIITKPTDEMKEATDATMTGTEHEVVDLTGDETEDRPDEKMPVIVVGDVPKAGQEKKKDTEPEQPTETTTAEPTFKPPAPPPHPEFTSRQDWRTHMEEKHLVPCAWHMGDGPKATDLCTSLLPCSP